MDIENQEYFGLKVHSEERLHQLSRDVASRQGNSLTKGCRNLPLADLRKTVSEVSYAESETSIVKSTSVKRTKVALGYPQVRGRVKKS